MLNDLIPGLRNLRSAFLTGSLILGSLYIFCADRVKREITPRSSLEQILHLSHWMSTALIGGACFLVGSLYTNGLEGAVDWIHRKQILKEVSGVHPRAYRRFLQSFAPLSVAARGRLVVEAGRFYGEYAKISPSSTEDEYTVARQEFIDRVLTDVLWLEGKLAGTSLEDPYRQYRAEGELQLGTALLLPVVSIAVSYAIRLQGRYTTMFVGLMTLLAIKLADYGLYYFRRAHSFIAHYISDGVVLTPSMETLKRSSLDRSLKQSRRVTLMRPTSKSGSSLGKSSASKKGRRSRGA